MTPAQRLERVLSGLDLLRKHVDNHEAHTNECAADPDDGHCDCGGIRLRDLADAVREDVAALRAALVERTCGTCVHYYERRCSNLEQRHFYALDIPPDDGCIKGWAPSEDAPDRVEG